MGKKKYNPKLQMVFIRGNPGSGKDSFADAIIKCIAPLQANVKKFPFADCLKKEAAEVFNLDYDKLMNDYEYKAKHRPELIQLGNERRAENQAYWRDKNWQAIAEWLKTECTEHKSQFNIALIPDVRYNDEMRDGELLVDIEFSSGFHSVYIRVSDEAMIQRLNNSFEAFGKLKYLQNDVSERDVLFNSFPYSLIVDNSGRKDELEYDAMKLISRIAAMVK